MPPSADRDLYQIPAGTILTLRRLKLALLASIVVPALLFIAGAWDERSELLAAAENEAKANVAVLKEHVLKTIETDELLLREVDHQIQGKSWDLIRSESPALSATIANMHANMPQVSLVAVADANGVI